MNDASLNLIADKVYSGQRLSEADALTLFETPDLLSVGKLADYANRRLNGDRVFYNINRHINPTNICAMSCKFCAFSRKPGEEGAYAFDLEQILQRAGEAVAQGATEIHMVGGLHPRWPFKTYLQKIAAIHAAHPDVHIKAFTVVELDWIARRERRPIDEILRDLRDAGLGSLPGGGAEIFHPEIREKICDTKVTGDQWIATHRLAHNSGMRSNCTMLYGHVESFFHRVDHMRRLRELQDETRGFNVFIPLAFQPFENEMGVHRYTFGFDDLKTLAVARLYLDNFQNIKAYWIMLGQDIAQLGLNFGANDFDGTVTEENISRMAGGRSGMSMSRSDLETMIRRCGRTPIERDTLYRPIVRGQTDASTPEQGAQGALPVKVTAVGSGDFYSDGSAPEKLVEAAMNAPIFELGELAAAKKSLCDEPQSRCSPAFILKLAALKNPADHSFNLTGAFVAHEVNTDIGPATVVLDCDGLDELDGECEHIDTVAAIYEAIKTCVRKFPDATLVLAGFRSIWSLARKANLTLPEMATNLRNAGISRVESSPGERETDLTEAEMTRLHESFHAADLKTSGKVEIVASLFNNLTPNWEAFVRRLLTLRQLSAKTRGLHSVQITTQAATSTMSTVSNKITPAEYLRGVALARLVMAEDCIVSTPLLTIPTHNGGQSAGIDGTQHPAEKTATVALSFGSADLGYIPLHQISYLRILEDIAATGGDRKPQDPAFERSAIPAHLLSHISQLRHRPTMPARAN